MYQINDYIVYGRTGACKITDIRTSKNTSAIKDQLYYVLQPLHENCVIYTPVNTKLFMRPVISAEEAERLIDTIPSIHAEPYYNDSMQGLAKHYETVLQYHDCADLIELSMSIYTKKQTAEQQNRKLGLIDERYMKQTEELLYGELSLTLGIPKDDVPGYIASRVESINTRKTKLN
jgi:CarD family transcriptional regulator